MKVIRRVPPLLLFDDSMRGWSQNSIAVVFVALQRFWKTGLTAVGTRG